MPKNTELTRRMSMTVETAMDIYLMAELVQKAILAPKPELVLKAKRLQRLVLKLYPELKVHLEK